MSDPIDLSVVIVTWNAREDAQRCIASVAGSARPVREIIVVDNGSTDGTVEHVRLLFPTATIIANRSNLGHVRAANMGFARAVGRYVLILDSDTEFDSHVLPAAVEFLAREPRAHICAPRLYYADGRLQETNRNLPTAAAGLFGRRSVLTRLWPNNPFAVRYLRRDLLNQPNPYPVQQVSAAFMMFRSNVIDRIGGWDEGFLGYWVDSDWCSRANEAGLGVWVLPHLSATHHEGNRAGVRKTWPRLWMFHHGAMRLYQKHYTRGPLDPRLWFAAAMLMIRFTLLAAVDPLLPPPKPNSRPDGDRQASPAANCDGRIAAQEQRR